MRRVRASAAQLLDLKRQLTHRAVFIVLSGHYYRCIRTAHERLDQTTTFGGIPVRVIRVHTPRRHRLKTTEYSRARLIDARQTPAVSFSAFFYIYIRYRVHTTTTTTRSRVGERGLLTSAWWLSPIK